MKLLFIGDINARGGRETLSRLLPDLRREFTPDLVIANVENAAHGLGVTPTIAGEILADGVDVMTGGNHLFDRKEILDYLPEQPRLLRPANYPPDVPGFNDCPFRTFDRLARHASSKVAVRIIDFHAEATSEKIAFARYVDGRASVVIGTHTHVQTADEKILPGGTAHISDVGMTGSHAGVIGVRADLIINRFTTGLPTRFEPALMLHAVVVDIDEFTGKARSIERICRRNG